MPGTETSRCRLCLSTPLGVEAAGFAPKLADALAGGDVASLIIAAEPAKLQPLAEALVPIAQARGVAALIQNDTRIAGRTRADGVHVDGGEADLATAIAARRSGKLIVGAANLRSRHDAMVAGELEPDYVFFGRLDGDTGDAIFDKALDLAAWWASIALIPAVVMGGRAIASVTEASEAGIEFVMLSRAVWDYPAGPAAAVAEANRLLASVMEPVR